ncbi:hypothetical protein DIPPA_28732 [Diplonema papillatum]|nr:hypothetical protein DIPPA_28732 [Diplonema papillatum]
MVVATKTGSAAVDEAHGGLRGQRGKRHEEGDTRRLHPKKRQSAELDAPPSRPRPAVMQTRASSYPTLGRAVPGVRSPATEADTTRSRNALANGAFSTSSAVSPTAVARVARVDRGHGSDRAGATGDQKARRSPEHLVALPADAAGTRATENQKVRLLMKLLRVSPADNRVTEICARVTGSEACGSDEEEATRACAMDDQTVRGLTQRLDMSPENSPVKEVWACRELDEVVVTRTEDQNVRRLLKLLNSLSENNHATPTYAQEKDDTGCIGLVATATTTTTTAALERKVKLLMKEDNYTEHNSVDEAVAASIGAPTDQRAGQSAKQTGASPDCLRAVNEICATSTGSTDSDACIWSGDVASVRGATTCQNIAQTKWRIIQLVKDLDLPPEKLHVWEANLRAIHAAGSTGASREWKSTKQLGGDRLRHADESSASSAESIENGTCIGCDEAAVATRGAPRGQNFGWTNRRTMPSVKETDLPSEEFHVWEATSAGLRGSTANQKARQLMRLPDSAPADQHTNAGSVRSIGTASASAASDTCIGIDDAVAAMRGTTRGSKVAKAKWRIRRLVKELGLPPAELLAWEANLRAIHAAGSAGEERAVAKDVARLLRYKKATLRALAAIAARESMLAARPRHGAHARELAAATACVRRLLDAWKACLAAPMPFHWQGRDYEAKMASGG